MPSGQATKERKQKKRKERRERFSTRNLSGENHKTRRTFQRTSTQKPGRSKKDQKRKTSSISGCYQHRARAQDGPIRGDQFPTQHLSEQNPKPRRTVQRTTHQKPGRNNKNHKRKTGSISSCLPHQTRAQEGPIHQELFTTQLVRAEP